MKDCDSSLRRCANCKGPHVASSSECQRNKDAREIERLRQSGSTFSEARRVINSKKATQNTNKVTSNTEPTSTQRWKSIQVEADVHQSPGQYFDSPQENDSSYANAVKKNTTPTHRQKDTESFDMKRYLDQAISSMTVKLVSFLQEVFSLQMNKENSRERKLLLISLAKHHFGTNVDIEAVCGSLEFQLPSDADTNLNNNTMDKHRNVENDAPIIQMSKENNKDSDTLSDSSPPSQILHPRKSIRNVKNKEAPGKKGNKQNVSKRK